MAANLSVHVTGESIVQMPGGQVARIPMNVAPEVAAAAILSATGSAFHVTLRDRTIEPLLHELQTMAAALAASKLREEELADRQERSDKYANSLHIKLLVTNKDNTELQGRILSLQKQNAELESRVESLQKQLNEEHASSAVIRASNAELQAQVSSLKSCVEDLYTRVDALTKERDALAAAGLVDAELSRVGEFALRLETGLVKHVWPGAGRDGSPVRHLTQISNFFNYFDADGCLAAVQQVPKSYFTTLAPPEFANFQKGDSKSFAEVHARWTTLLGRCSPMVEVVRDLKKRRGDVAHGHRPQQGSSPASIVRDLEAAHAEYQRHAGVTDDRVNSAVECIRLLEPLTDHCAAVFGFAE